MPYSSLSSLARGLQAHLKDSAHERKEAHLDLRPFLTRDDEQLLSTAPGDERSERASGRVAVNKEQLDALAQLDTRGMGWLGSNTADSSASKAAAGSSSNSDPSALQVLHCMC